MNNQDNPGTDTRKRSDERYRQLLDNLNCGVQENDCDGVITYSNRAHHLILGYDPGELPGRMIWDFQPTSADKESLRDYLRHLVKEQPAPVPYLTKCMKKDGSLVDLSIDWDYEYDNDGNLKGFISHITDITELRKAEEDLRQRTRGLATLLDVSRTFVSSLDLKKVLQAIVDGVAKLIGLNTAAVYLLEGEMLHLWATTPPLPDKFPDNLRIAPLADHCRIGEVVASGKPVLVSDMRKADLTPAERSVTEERDLRTVLYLPLIADMEVVGALIVGSSGETSRISDAEIDLSCTLSNFAALAVRNAQLFRSGQRYASELEQTLTERKLAEEERENLRMRLTHSQKLESLGRLAGGVAHDYNNMLSVILGHTELALMRIDPSYLIYADLKQIRKATERSANLTQQLLAFARRQAIAPRVLNFNETVEGMLTLLERLISEDIQLKWLPCEDVWPVRVDPAQIDQILVNLCVNARDSIVGTGIVTIETDNRILDESYCAGRAGLVPGEYAVLSVSDNGYGMDDETVEKLFEPFFTTKEMGKGTGLGLATVYGIVKQNDGFIDIQSKPDQGSKFEIYLPRCMDETKRVQSAIKEERVLNGHETVLLVEDEPALIDVCRNMLEMQGYRVLVASRPGEAIRLVEESGEDIHLLMTDIVMPEMNGKELSRRLMSVYPNLKCLYMSGYTDQIIARHGVLDKGINFIHKPFTMQRLALKVREVLDHGHGGREKGEV